MPECRNCQKPETEDTKLYPHVKHKSLKTDDVFFICRECLIHKEMICEFCNKPTMDVTFRYIKDYSFYNNACISCLCFLKAEFYVDYCTPDENRDASPRPEDWTMGKKNRLSGQDTIDLVKLEKRLVALENRDAT